MIARAGLVGGGVIGAGWAARLLLNGIDVAMYDPDPELERKLDHVIGKARRAWRRLFPGWTVAEGRLTIAASVAEAVRAAPFVQESLPEREDVKRRVLAEIEHAAPADALIASSTSGLLPSRLQAALRHPERFVVGHPFNPVYLLPLVEVCGGERTSEEAVAQAVALYRGLGMRPLVVRQEIDGFIADRLLEALWREALWLVRDGIATTSEIDDAIRYGAGLRWSFMGTFLTYRLAGGEAGMRHFLAQFGPALKLPWTKLEAPDLTDALIDRVTAQSDEQADGVSIRALEEVRDNCLVAVLDALRRQDFGAGAVLRAWAPHEPAKLRIHTGTVRPDWIDYNGHMTDFRYAQMFSAATDALLARAGAAGAYLTSGSFFTVETHTAFRAEARQDEALTVTAQVLAFDGKRLHVFFELVAGEENRLAATSEQMLLHVDATTRRSAPAGAAVHEALAKLAEEHANLPRPETAGRAIGARR